MHVAIIYLKCEIVSYLSAGISVGQLIFFGGGEEGGGDFVLLAITLLEFYNPISRSDRIEFDVGG